MKKILCISFTALIIIFCLVPAFAAPDDAVEFSAYDGYGYEDYGYGDDYYADFSDEDLFTEITDENASFPLFEEEETLATAPVIDPSITNVFEITEPDSYGAESIPTERKLPRLVDAAGIIDDTKEAGLLQKLDEISEKRKIDLAVVTTAELKGKEPEEFADDYYDYNGFGFGSKRSGILLLISINPRYVYISTCGKGQKIITNGEIDPVIDTFYDEIKAGDYYSACNIFADTAEKEIKSLSRLPIYLIFISLAIGFIIASISTSSGKATHKTAAVVTKAASYMIAGSLLFTQKDDELIDKVVNKTLRAASTPRTGGSSGGTHVSSSGTTHGGGGRKF